MKKIRFLLIFTICLFIFKTNVNAASIFKVGDNYYDTLSEAITDAETSKNEIVLQSDYSGQCNGELNYTCGFDGLEVASNQNITINLNNHKIISGNFYVKNEGTIIIKNGSIYSNYGLTHMFRNKENAKMTVSDVTIDSNYNAAYIFYNNGDLNLSQVNILYDENKSYNSSRFLYNSKSVNIKNCNFTSKNDIFENIGNMTINGGTYKKLANVGNNYISGTTTINGGTFVSQESELFYVQAPGKLIINDATITGKGIEIGCMKAPNKCGGSPIVTINNVNMTTTNELINIDSFADYNTELPQLTINGGSFKTNTSNGFITIYNPAIIKINGGSINAPYSNGLGDITTTNTTKITIGNNDGKVNSSPTIYMPQGILGDTSYNGLKNIDYFDGVITLKQEIMEKHGLGSIPEEYKICYSKVENAIKAELKTSCDENKEENNIISSSSDSSSTKKETKVDNPKTGIYLNISIIAILILIATGSYIYMKKYNKFPKVK